MKITIFSFKNKNNIQEIKQKSSTTFKNFEQIFPVALIIEYKFYKQ